MSVIIDKKTVVGPNIVNNGSVLYLDAANLYSYSGSGTLWKDLTPNNNNGTLVPAPTFNSSPTGYFTFSGNYVDCGSSITGSLGDNSYTTTGSFDIWVKPNSTVNGTLFSYRSIQNLAQANVRFQMDCQGSAGTFVIYRAFFGGIGYTLASTGTFPINNWYNVVGVRNGDIISIYVNGVFQNSASNFRFVDGAHVLTIGARRNSLGLGEYFSGDMSNAKIYNRALSANEIKQNYDALKSRFGL